MLSLVGKMNRIWDKKKQKKKQSLTVLLFCFTGGSAGGLLAKPIELIVVPMATCLGLGVKKVFFSKFFSWNYKKQNIILLEKKDFESNA